MKRNPKVSVIIPAYNVGPYITETLESLFAQTFGDWEAIVVNDGSTDDTEARVRPYLPRIVYLSQSNGGVMAARNAGLRAASGRYIALLDGDDVWMPRFLEVLAAMLESDGGLGGAFPNAVFWGSPRYDGRLHQDLFPVASPVTFERVLRRECHIFGSLVLRRDAVEALDGFDEGLRGQGSEDFDLWLRMLLNGYRFGFTREPLVRYRWRSDSLSNSGLAQLECLISVYEKLAAEPLVAGQDRTWINARLPSLRTQLRLAEFREYLKGWLKRR